jgi:hypothetical protein
MAKGTSTAKDTSKSKCPVGTLKMRPMCLHPKNQPKHLILTAAEETALHQFAARVVKAGEILYTKVPRDKAEPVLRRKWLYIANQIR